MSKTDLEQGLNLTNDGKVPARRFPEFRNFPLWQKLQLNQVLDYARPDKYIVNSTNYKTAGIPVLTANKSFVLGYTQEDFGIYEYLPVVIFDDFTTDKKFVDFPFKIKSSAIKILKPKNNEDLKFIFEVMNQIKFEVSDHKRHYISEYQNLVVKIPEFTEQKKIADCLTSLDNLISQKQSELGALAKYKKGLLQQLFPQGDHSLPAKRFPEFENSPPWQEKKLSDIFNIIDGDRGGNYPKEREFFREGFCLFLNAKNVTTNGFNFSNCNFMSQEKDSKLRAGRLNNLDFVLTTRGSIGNVAYNKDIPYQVMRINSGMVILRKKVDNDVVHEYCDIFFKSDIFIQQVQIMGFGSVQPQLTVGIINNFNLPIPKQPEEQRQIADCLTSLDSLIDLKQQELDKLGIYKKGLLQQLLVQG